MSLTGAFYVGLYGRSSALVQSAGNESSIAPGGGNFFSVVDLSAADVGGEKSALEFLCQVGRAGIM